MKCRECGKPSYNDLCPDCFLQSRGRMKYTPQTVGNCDKCGKAIFEPKACHTMNYGKNMLCNECEEKWRKLYDTTKLGEIFKTLGKEAHEIEWEKIFKLWLKNNPSRRDSK
jgi:NMD protein affecting ribosome stability and mRNA decay